MSAKRVFHYLMTDPPDRLKRTPCECDICQESRRIDRLTTTRWVRRKTLQSELAHLYNAYFEARAELELYEAHMRETAPTPQRGTP